MELFISFMVSVGASVVGYYICKWPDGDKQAATARTEALTEKKPRRHVISRTCAVLLKMELRGIEPLSENQFPVLLLS